MSNKSQFEKLYFDIADEVYRYAYFKLGNQTEAEDVTSETFLRMITKDNLAEVENPKLWAIGVARNIVYEMYRERKLENAVPAGRQGIQNTEDSEIPDPEQEPDAQALTEEMYVLIKEKLNELDEATREVIVLKTWEELKFSEIAALQNEKESTVKLRYYRGLEKLKLLIEEEDRRASLATAKVVTLPILLAGFARLGTEPVYAISSQFTTSLNELLQTQYLATTGANLNINSQIMESTNTNELSGNIPYAKQLRALTKGQMSLLAVVSAIVGITVLLCLGSLISSGVNNGANTGNASATSAASAQSSTSVPAATSTVSSADPTSGWRTVNTTSWSFKMPADWSYQNCPTLPSVTLQTSGGSAADLDPRPNCGAGVGIGPAIYKMTSISPYMLRPGYRPDRFRYSEIENIAIDGVSAQLFRVEAIDPAEGLTANGDRVAYTALIESKLTTVSLGDGQNLAEMRLLLSTLDLKY